jgi:hypothetical protein
MEKKVVFTDEGYESATRREIEQAQEAIEAVLSSWNALKLTAINSKSDLYDLLNAPEQMFREALMSVTRQSSDTNVPTPAPRPVNPEPFYAAVRHAKSFPYTDRQYGLFSVSKGKITTVPEQVELYVNARTLYVESEAQAQFFADYEAFLRTFNKVNELTGGSLTRVGGYRAAWSQVLQLPPEGFDSYPAQMRVDVLREYLQML